VSNYKEVWQIAILILAFACPCFGQQNSGQSRPASPLIDINRPSVYLKYVKAETLKSRHGDSVQLIWLELRNNTRWRISSVGLPDEFGGSGWFYTGVTDDPCHTDIYPSIGNGGDVAGPVGVGAGESTPLTVLATHLSRGLAVEISFNFEWDLSAGVRHSLWFGHSDLPQQIQTSLPYMDSIPRPHSNCRDRPFVGGHEPPIVPYPVTVIMPSLDQLLLPTTKIPPATKKN
jgi:hypothetical protein